MKKCTEVWIFAKSLCFALLFSSTFFVAISHRHWGENAYAGQPQKVEIKYFALNPADYVGKVVEIEGQLRASGPGSSWLLLEDLTGKVLVTTTQLSEPLFCPIGSYARIKGKLTFLGDEFGLYFSMLRLISCDSQEPWLQSLFGWTLQKLVFLFAP